jgi:tetratricopeptide (TPR) repeat protein
MVQRCWRAGYAALIAVAVYWSAHGAGDTAEIIQRHRNLGKAFYENPTTQVEAIAEFKAALALAPNSVPEKLNYGLALLRGGRTTEGIALLEQVQRLNPSLPHTWFNLGLNYKRNGETQKAIAQFERMIALIPAEPIGHYQLGSLYRQVGRRAEAAAQFQRASELNPLLVAAHFQLYNLYRQQSRQQDAARELEIFQRLRQKQEGAAIPEDVDWCSYAEIYDPPRSPTAPTVPAHPEFADKIIATSVAGAKAGGLTVIDSSGTGRIDLLVWSSGGVQLYRSGAVLAKDSGLDGLTGVIFVAPGDFNNDGLMDLCVLTEAGPLLYRNTGGRFIRTGAKLPKRRFERAVWIDYDHDYDLDLILLGRSPALLRNEGASGFADHTMDFPFVKGLPKDAWKLRAIPDTKAFDLAVLYQDRPAVLYRDQLGGKYTVEAYVGPAPDDSQVESDFDNDGLPDRARMDAGGKVHVLLNRTPGGSRWIRVQLTGVKNLRLAQDAEVEIKAGQLYRKELYAGVPLLFDTGGYDRVDTVRITWPNGLIQNETNQVTNQSHHYTEAQRLSGSCPMIWTWNGRDFQFVTDVLGVAPLGASDGDGRYFPVNHVEYVQIPRSQLVATGGQYEIRITEELSEVSYLDQVELAAVDHPSGTEIFTNDKFRGPPFPEFRLFAVTKRIYPISARDDEGRNVLPQLLERDGHYPDQFPRTSLGSAKPHTLELDFGNAAPFGRAVLFLNGWVDWPDGSTFRAASQDPHHALIMPYLQMQDANGNWKTVNADMGMPAGKPKTIAVKLRFPSASRKLRIVTSLCVYWDEIFLSEGESRAVEKPAPVPLDSAELHFRGFSAARIDPERKQPDTFYYASVSPTSFWNPTPGWYTRYGNVRELLTHADDRLVIMGSGDELRLHFSARALPAPPAGWKRDFLLKVEGWAKDRDPNTAFSDSVEPLPFHGMSRYPYPPTEHYPNDAAHEQYRRQYNTRPALRLLRPLREGTE